MKRRSVSMICAVVVIMIAIFSYVVFHDKENSTDNRNLNHPAHKMVNSSGQEEEGQQTGSLDAATTQNSGQRGKALTQKEKKITQEAKKDQITKQDSRTGKGITAIGDSVMIGVEPYLKERIPGVTVDGKVGRQMSQAQEVIDELEARGKLGDQIIVELGTNGPFNKKQLRSLLESLSDAERVLLVTTRVPKDWQDTVNANIKEVAPEFSNTKVVDWYLASEGKDNYFYQDGVHLKPDGGKYYASLLVEALQE